MTDFTANPSRCRPRLPARRGAIALLVLAALIAVPLWNAGSVSRAQDATPTPTPDGPPFSLPFTDAPGPSTWLLEQHYGNTVAAYNFGDAWYEFGQGLHFGVDFEARCGTPVHAIADGVVAYVDAEGFGAGPHNLVIEHPGTGYASLYGHLLRVPALVRGQTVQRGEVIALSGDPDGSCGSRPHLHLEIRSANYQTAYNPLPFFDAPWHMIASIGPVTNAFQQDLTAPTRWMRIEDQPDVSFSGNLLNTYQRPWPPKLERREATTAPPARRLPTLTNAARVTQSVVHADGWNVGSWWDAADPDAVYLVDTMRGIDGADVDVYRQPLDGSARRYYAALPISVPSPDGSVTVQDAGGGQVRVTRREDGASWLVNTDGFLPVVSPDGTRLLWEQLFGEIVPGQTPPSARIWISALDGSDRRLVTTVTDGTVQWLDARRLLIAKRITYTAETRLSVLDVDRDPLEAQPLGSFGFVRGLEVAPGGRWIAFLTPFQEDPAASGIVVLRTLPGSTPRTLSAFGSYHWRDDRTLYLLSFDPTQDAHALGVIGALGGDVRWLTDPATLPIRVANGEWSVSPDGTQIAYVDATDYALMRLTVSAE
jgi:hypothetical protein